MAPSTRTRRQRSKPQASVEAPADSAPLLSDGKNPGNDRESSNTGYEPDMTISFVAGVWTPVPQTYNPEAYDPEGQMQWTPEPEPYVPETYAAWGRKHFGDDWYELRKTMLQERNIYGYDPVYTSRQRDLRVMEHKVEGRPFEPWDGVLNKGWQQLWARLSKDLPSVETPGTPASFQLNDSDSNVSGYSTYPPTPEPRVLTPEPDNPWELLELNRKRMHWDEETYQFERVFLKESLIDKARNKREDEKGDQQCEEELEEIRKVKYLPGTLVKSGEYEDRMRKFDLRAQGWTQEQIEAADRADTAAWKWQLKNPQPRGLSLFGPPLTQEESDAYDAWLQKERAARLRIYGELPPGGSGPLGQLTQKEQDAYDTWRRNIHARVSSQLRAPTPQATKNTARKTLGGRITNNKEQRASRRLAHKPPQFGIFTPPARNPSNASKPNSLGLRNRASPKESIAAKGAKSRGISKSGRKGTNRPKRSKKRSED